MRVRVRVNLRLTLTLTLTLTLPLTLTLTLTRLQTVDLSSNIRRRMLPWMDAAVNELGPALVALLTRCEAGPKPNPNANPNPNPDPNLRPNPSPTPTPHPAAHPNQVRAAAHAGAWSCREGRWQRARGARWLRGGGGGA